MAGKKINFKYVYTSFLIVIAIIVGIIIARYWHFPIEETLNLMDLITLVTTIFLAVYIPEVLDRKLQVSRDRKKLIEERLDDLQLLFRRINILVQDSTIVNERDILMVNNTLDVCLHRLSTIASLVKYSKSKLPMDEEITEIVELAKKYKKLLWVEDPHVVTTSYPNDTKQKEEKLYDLIDEKTCLLLFKINEIE